MSGMASPIEVFCSYAPADEAWMRKLEAHLTLLSHQGRISLWHRRLLTAGTNWQEVIDTRLETASIILLLISADFFTSDYCYGIEMQRALERQEAGEARVIPILVRPVDWTNAPFAHLQALPTDGRPIVSWRDKDSALTDVATGIRRVIVEEVSQLSASAQRAALPQIWNIPYARNPVFTGREAVLTRLADSLFRGQAVALSQPQAISGLGGIGKTQIAVEYAYQHRQDYQTVLWTRADTTDALVSGYVALAGLLHLPERDAQEQGATVQAVMRWLTTHTGWLLILDNADDLSRVRSFLPSTFSGHLLLTTRAHAMGRLAQRIEVDIMQEDQGALLLLRRAGLLSPEAFVLEASPADMSLACEISSELGGLPLALDQVGAYIEETECGLTRYLELFRTYRTLLISRRGGQVADHPEPVATTWSLSFEQVQQRSPAAADLLSVCAFLAPDAIPEEVIMQGATHLGPYLGQIAKDPLILNEALATLFAYSLIQREMVTRTLSIHRLVQAVVYDAMDVPTQNTWAERAIRAVLTVLPEVAQGDWARWERIIGHAQVCAQHIMQSGSTFREAVLLLRQTAWYLAVHARSSEAECLEKRVYAISERVQGPEHIDTVRDGSVLAGSYLVQGKYELAEPLLAHALTIHEQQFGPLHPLTAVSLDDLAGLYQNQGKYRQAELLYQRALAIREEQLGPTDVATALTLDHLAHLYWEQGNYELAESLLTRALAICEQQLGSLNPHNTIMLNNLAVLYSKQGKDELAESFHQRALVICEREPGPHRLHANSNLTNLAILYLKQGRNEEAELLMRRALTFCEQTLGETHPKTTKNPT